jgi:hypothetical protein
MRSSVLAFVSSSIGFAGLAPAAVAQEPEPTVVAAPPTQQDPLLLGTGVHQYRWVPDFGRLGEGKELGSTHGGVVVARDGTIYANTDTEHAVIGFAPDGRIVGSWGKEFHGGAHGMCLVVEDGVEFVYLAHTRRHEVVKCDARRQGGGDDRLAGGERHLRQRDAVPADRGRGGAGRPHLRRRRLRQVRGCTCSTATASTRRRSAGRAVLPASCRRRTACGSIRAARSRCCWSAIARTIGCSGSRCTATTCVRSTRTCARPCNVAPLFDGGLAVAELTGRVTILDREGKVVGRLGEQPDETLRATRDVARERWRDGVFHAPHGIAAGADGSLYVLEWNATGRLVKLVPTVPRPVPPVVPAAPGDGAKPVDVPK